MEQIFNKFINSSDPYLNEQMVELTELQLMQTNEENIYDPTQDDTLEASTKFYVDDLQIPIPVSPRGPPCRDIFAGNLNFAVEVNSKDINKKKYLYSHRLNRIFVDMECDFPMQFNWDPTPDTSTMYVRSTVVFSDEAQAEKRVETCLQHVHAKGTEGANQHIIRNVLHSSREIGADGVFYCGSPDATDSWYSVVVQLTKTGVEPCKHAYKFVCKNSCSTGINRRPIMIIFTLEDMMGNVLGRQTVGARVCSCPRRDIGKDEASECGAPGPGKRLITTPAPAPRTKKIKLEVTINEDHDDVVWPLPSIRLDRRTILMGLEVMLGMTLQAGDKWRHDPTAKDEYTNRINKLTKAIEGFK